MESAVEELKRCAGLPFEIDLLPGKYKDPKNHFDPTVIEALLDGLENVEIDEFWRDWQVEDPELDSTPPAVEIALSNGEDQPVAGGRIQAAKGPCTAVTASRTRPSTPRTTSGR